MLELNTFTIVARCPRTAHLGIAVATAVPAVGAMCPYTRPRVGAVSTQSWVNPYLAIGILSRLAEGLDADAALDEAIAADDARDFRQVGVVDAAGRAAAWSGASCTQWFGHHIGEGVAVFGNMLTGPEVLSSMMAAFTGSTSETLDERLMLALEAADAVGGDKRGKQSACLRVQGEEDYALVDLRADENARPIPELRRILTIARQQLFPFVAGMPKRGLPAEPAPQAVVDLLALSPPDRPGGGGSHP
jgi:uncharacterized Ntn-hydrolase superfamily protein